MSWCRRRGAGQLWSPKNRWRVGSQKKFFKDSRKLQRYNYAATMASAARRQIIGGGALINKSRWRPRTALPLGGIYSCLKASIASVALAVYKLYRCDSCFHGCMVL